MAVAKAASESVGTIRANLRRVASESGMTQEEIGVRMGFSKDSARKAVSRLLNTDAEYDPRLSTLLAFAKAIGKDLKSLV
jgi:transcriptional regulator with XRE-family HTH domain